MAALVSIVFMPAARAATLENQLFVCTGELISHSANNYSIKNTWTKDEYPMDCFTDNDKLLRQILSVCRVGDVCVVSAKGEMGNGGQHLIQKIFEIQRSQDKVKDLKSLESQ